MVWKRTWKFSTGVLLLSTWIIFLKNAQAQESTAPPFIYSLQLGAYRTESEALNAKKLYEEMGYFPTSIENNSGVPGFKVLAGQFSNYMDAFVWKSSSRKSGGDAFIVKKVNTAGMTQFPANRSPHNTIFSFESSFSASPDVSLPETPQTVEIDQLIKDASFDAAELRATQFKEGLSADALDRAWCIQKLAWINFKKGKTEEALDLYKQVTEGRIRSPRSIRAECAFSVGHVYHARKMRVKAYQTFSELLSFFDDDENKCNALVELGGLSMELVRSGMGTADDCRRICERAMAYPSSSEKALKSKATASLMRLETYYLIDLDYPAVVTLADKHLQEFPGIPREREWALFFKGQALFNLGDSMNAATCFSLILKENLSIDNQFAGCDAKSFARYKLAACHYKSHKPSEAKKELDYLIQNPSTSDKNINKAAREMYPIFGQQ